MPGLRVWRPDSTLSFDGSASLLRFIGTITVSGSGSQNIPALAGGRPWIFARSNGGQATGWQVPGVSVSGTTISWGGGNPAVSLTIYYGLY